MSRSELFRRKCTDFDDIYIYPFHSYIMLTLDECQTPVLLQNFRGVVPKSKAKCYFNGMAPPNLRPSVLI